MTVGASGSNLNHQEMKIVERVFGEAFQQAVSRLDDEYGDRVKKFVRRLVFQHKPYLLVTPEGLTAIAAEVFKDEQVRYFVTMLRFDFFARWGEIHNKEMALIQNLADGLGLRNEQDGVMYTTENPGEDASPLDFRMRLATRPEALNVIHKNRWLLMLLLIQLYITPLSEEPPKKPSAPVGQT